MTLVELKEFLDVIHSSDDDKLQRLLDGAESEALNFMDRDDFGDLCPCDSNFDSQSEELQPDVKTAILLLAQAAYEAQPADAMELRKVAEKKLFPHRCNLGV